LSLFEAVAVELALFLVPFGILPEVPSSGGLSPSGRRFFPLVCWGGLCGRSSNSRL